MSEPGGFVLIPPGGGAQHWQPQPANGWIEVLTSPRIAGMPAGFSAGLQELPPLTHDLIQSVILERGPFFVPYIVSLVQLWSCW